MFRSSCHLGQVSVRSLQKAPCSLTGYYRQVTSHSEMILAQVRASAGAMARVGKNGKRPLSPCGDVMRSRSPDMAANSAAFDTRHQVSARDRSSSGTRHHRSERGGSSRHTSHRASTRDGSPLYPRHRGSERAGRDSTEKVCSALELTSSFIG